MDVRKKWSGRISIGSFLCLTTRKVSKLVPRLLLLMSLFGMSVVLSGCVGEALGCECVVCIEDGAVLLSVEDDNGNEIEDFVVEVVLNEASMGQPPNCDPEARDGSNSCTFGSELGYYHIIVNAPGYERQELAIRVFDEGEREVCCRACLSARDVTVTLSPL